MQFQASHFISESVARKAVTQTPSCACYCTSCLLCRVFQVEESTTVMVVFPSNKWMEIAYFQTKLSNSSEIMAALAQ